MSRVIPGRPLTAIQQGYVAEMIAGARRCPACAVIADAFRVLGVKRYRTSGRCILCKAADAGARRHAEGGRR